jgi:ABC-type transport system involved in Fe-S cluster assembly fused permease/ATPase subunit
MKLKKKLKKMKHQLKKKKVMLKLKMKKMKKKKKRKRKRLRKLKKNGKTSIKLNHFGPENLKILNLKNIQPSINQSPMIGKTI